jgi:hypothetical protein
MKSNFIVLDFSVEIPLGPQPKWQQLQDYNKIRSTYSNSNRGSSSSCPQDEEDVKAGGHQQLTSSSSSTTTPEVVNVDENLKDHSSPCVVGTITFLPNAIMIWIGWGTSLAPLSLQHEQQQEQDENRQNPPQIGTGMPIMGPLVVAMPQRHYKGAFGSTTTTSRMTNAMRMESPCSQLIGGDQELEIMLGNSMAMRLAQKIGKPVYVSCSLSNACNTTSSSRSNHEEEDAAAGGGGGMTISSIMKQQGSLDVDMEKSALVTHAAALAEQKIGKLILEKKGLLYQ